MVRHFLLPHVLTTHTQYPQTLCMCFYFSRIFIVRDKEKNEKNVDVMYATQFEGKNCILSRFQKLKLLVTGTGALL